MSSSRVQIELDRERLLLLRDLATASAMKSDVEVRAPPEGPATEERRLNVDLLGGLEAGDARRRCHLVNRLALRARPDLARRRRVTWATAVERLHRRVSEVRDLIHGLDRLPRRLARAPLAIVPPGPRRHGAGAGSRGSWYSVRMASLSSAPVLRPGVVPLDLEEIPCGPTRRLQKSFAEDGDSGVDLAFTFTTPGTCLRFGGRRPTSPCRHETGGVGDDRGQHSRGGRRPC